MVQIQQHNILTVLTKKPSFFTTIVTKSGRHLEDVSELLLFNV